MRNLALDATGPLVALMVLFAGGLPAQIFSSTSVQAIPDGPAPGILNDVRVTGFTTGTPITMRVTVNIAHTAVGDLHLFLVPPGLQWPGTDVAAPAAAQAAACGIVELSTGNGGTGDNFTGTQFVFVGDNNYDPGRTAVPITAGTPPFTGAFVAEGAGFLAATSLPNGFWRLAVFDSQAGNTGTLLSWSVEITTSSGPEVSLDDDGQNFGRRFAVADGGTVDLPAKPAAGAAYSQTWFLSDLGNAQLTFNNTGADIVAVSGQMNCTASVTTQPFSHFPSPLQAFIEGSGSSFVWECTPGSAGAFSFNVTIASDDPNEPTLSFKIAGTATASAEAEINVERPFGQSNTRIDGGTDVFSPSLATVAHNLAYTIRNHGVAALVLAGGPAFVSTGSSVNCTAVVSTQPPAAGTVAVGANVSFTITVTPQVPGAWSFMWSLASNDTDESAYNMTVAGNALSNGQPEVNVRAGSDLPDGGTDTVAGVLMGPVSRSYVVQNGGNAALTFSGSPIVATANAVNCSVVVTSPPTGPVSFGTSTAFVLTISPVSVGAWSFDWLFQCNDIDESTYNVSVAGIALEIPEIEVSRVSVVADGGTDVVLGATSGQPFTLTYTIANTGPASSVLTLITPVLPPFQLANCTAVVTTQPGNAIAGGTNTSMVIVVTPASASIFQCMVSFPSNDPNENPYNWLTDGTAIAPGAVECHLTRGATVADNGTDTLSGAAAGVLSTLTYTISNLGTGTLTIGTPVAFTGTPVNCTTAVTTQPAGSIAGQGSTTLVVSVTPVAAGAFSCTIQFANNDPNENPYNWTISGVTSGPSPEMDLSRGASPVADGGTADQLGNVAIGMAQVFTYTISNSGGVALNLTGGATLVVVNPVLNLASAQVIVQPVSSVAAGGATTFSVSIVVSATGPFVLAISIDNDDSNENPYNWLAMGDGVVPVVAEMELGRGVAIADGGSDAVPAVVAGNAVVLVYAVDNAGTGVLTLSTPVVTNLVNCSAAVTVLPATVVAPGAGTTFEITVTPAVAGSFIFDVSIANNDPNENPYDWSVQGTASLLAASPETGGRNADGGCSTAQSQAAWLWLILLCVLTVVLRSHRGPEAAASIGDQGA